MDGVHALTDVTGFGLAGHLLEICRGSKLSATVRFADLPLIPEAVGFVQEGVATGASTRNWNGYAGNWDPNAIRVPRRGKGRGGRAETPPDETLHRIGSSAITADDQPMNSCEFRVRWPLGRLIGSMTAAIDGTAPARGRSPSSVGMPRSCTRCSSARPPW